MSAAPLPVPGTTPGPDWANELNTAIGQKLEAVGGEIAAYTEDGNVPAATTGTVTLDLAVANIFRITPTGAVTIAVANAPAGTFTAFTLIVMNSTYTITWPAGTKFPNGAAPPLNGQTWLSGVVDDAGVITVGTSWSGVA